MKRVNVFVAFAVGWTSAIVCVWIVGSMRTQAAADDSVHVCVAASGAMRVIDVSASCPPGQPSLTLKKWSPDSVDVPDAPKPDSPALSALDPRRLDQLEKQIKALEDAADHGSLSNRVVAPFEVVDRAGKRIFYVEEGFVRMYNAAGSEVAVIQAMPTGGVFVGKSSTGGLVTSVGDGLRVIDNQTARIEIGRATPPDGTYSARFFTPGGKRVATIGQSGAGQGAATVADDQGRPRGFMVVASGGKAAIGVQNADGTVVATLGEGETGGGWLSLTNADGQPMVDAGTSDGGFGVVRAGPEAFKPGLGLLGLPGSYISGKAK
jgi:hypothetical protein